MREIATAHSIQAYPVGMSMFAPGEQDEIKAKRILFLSAIVAALVSGLVFGIATGLWLVAVFVGVLVAVAYIVTGAWATGAAERLDAWGTPESYQPWTRSELMWSGAFWPAVLPGHASVAVFNRLIYVLYGAGGGNHAQELKRQRVRKRFFVGCAIVVIATPSMFLIRRLLPQRKSVSAQQHDLTTREIATDTTTRWRILEIDLEPGERVSWNNPGDFDDGSIQFATPPCCAVWAWQFVKGNPNAIKHTSSERLENGLVRVDFANTWPNRVTLTISAETSRDAPFLIVRNQ